jgi:SAM-dependent methyltransferase
LYERYLVSAITSIWAADLVQRVDPKPGEAVLDVACGTGRELLPGWFARIGLGRVVGLDLNESMLAVARSVTLAGAPIEWREGSSLNLPFEDGSFGLVLCQLGLQFVPDRPRALRDEACANAGRSGRPECLQHDRARAGGPRLCDTLIRPNASRIKRAEHIFQTADEVRLLLDAAGFHEARISTVTKQITFPSVLDYVRFQLIAPPMAALLGERSEAERDAVVQTVAPETKRLLGPAMLQCFTVTA